MQAEIETNLPVDRFRCPVCWTIVAPEALSVEHVPPQSVRPLVNETYLPNLFTCIQCNNSAGAYGQNELKEFVIQQLFRRGEHKGSITARVHGTLSQRGVLSCPS